MPTDFILLLTQSRLKKNMKKSLGTNTTISKQNNETIIKVSGTLPEKWMEHALLAWVIVWSTLGSIVFYYWVNGNFTSDQKAFFMVYLAFWGFFEYRSVYSLLYKKFGYELLKLKDGHLYYTKNFLGLGKAHRYDLKNVSELGIIEHSRRSFAGAYNKSFWIVGNERVGFNHISKKVALAMQVTDKEAKEIVRLIKAAKN